MENEDEIYNTISAFTDPYARRSTSGNAVDPNNFDSPYNKEIDIPETFKDVILKICPEIIDVKSNGYRENVMYDAMTFDAIKKYLVGVVGLRVRG